VGLGLGDLLAIGAALLYLVSKFLAFFTINYRGVVDISSSLNGWSGSRGVWNLLEIVVVVAVVVGAVVGALLLPTVTGLRGIVFPVCGVLLFGLTLIAFFDVRRVANDSGTPGGPGIGFVLGLILPLVIIAAGVMKLGLLPGDGVVSLASGGAVAATADGMAPFSSPYYPGGPGRPGGPTPPGGSAPPPGLPGGNRPAGPPTGSPGAYGGPPPLQGPYGAPPAGNPGAPPNAPGGYGMPPGGPGGYGAPPTGVPGPYGTPPPGSPGGPSGNGGPPPQPR